MYKPNIQNNEFDINTFNVVKKRLEQDLLSINENPKSEVKIAIKNMPPPTPKSPDENPTTKPIIAQVTPTIIRIASITNKIAPNTLLFITIPLLVNHNLLELMLFYHNYQIYVQT